MNHYRARLQAYLLTLLIFLSLFICGLSVHAEVYTGKRLVFKKAVSDTGDLHHLIITDDVLAGGAYNNNKMQFFDIADPINPKLAYSHSISAHFSSIAANGIYMYGGHFTLSPRQGWLDIFDVTDPYSPELVCHYSARDVVSGIDFLSPDVLLLAEDDAGLSILDVSNFNTPIVIDSRHRWNSQHLQISGNFAAVGDTTINNNRVILYDISNKTTIGYVGSISIPGKMHDIEFSGSTVYAAQANAGVKIVDASDPADPVLINTITGIGEAWSVQVVDSMLYVASDESLIIYDVTDPASPIKRFDHPTEGIAKGVTVKGPYIYVGTEDSLQLFMLEENPLTIEYMKDGPIEMGEVMLVHWTSKLDTSGSAVKFELWNDTGWVADLGYAHNPLGEEITAIALPAVAGGDYRIRLSSAWNPQYAIDGGTFGFRLHNSVQTGHWTQYE